MTRSNSGGGDSPKFLAKALFSLEPFARVLLIEDSEEQMVLVRNALEEFGEGRYQLEWANQLRDGINRLFAGQVDVVLLDLGLPESSGPVSYIAVREAAPNVPVIVLTADGREETVQLVINGGAEGFLVKQEVTGEKLIRVIGEAISRKKSQNSTLPVPPLKFRGDAWRWQTSGPVTPPLIFSADSLRSRPNGPPILKPTPGQ